MREKPSSDLILRVQLIPKPLHRINLRNAIGKHQWQKKLRPKLFAAQKKLACHLCGEKLEKPSDLKAHEEWSYDESVTPALALLETISLICESCHRCEHFLHTVIMVQEGEYPADTLEAVAAHFCRVNRTSHDAFEDHLREATRENKRRSKLEWEIGFGNYSHMVDGEARERLELLTSSKSVVVSGPLRPSRRKT